MAKQSAKPKIDFYCHKIMNASVHYSSQSLEKDEFKLIFDHSIEKFIKNINHERFLYGKMHLFSRHIATSFRFLWKPSKALLGFYLILSVSFYTSILLAEEVITPTTSSVGKKIKPILLEKPALGNDVKILHKHGFSDEELEQTSKDLERRQLIIELQYAFRYRHRRRYAPYLLKKLEKMSPQGVHFNYFQALHHYRKKNYGKALLFVKKSLAINPEYARAWNLRGLLASHSQENRIAFNSFDSALKYAPFNPTYSYNAALLHYTLKEYSDAEDRIQYALDAKSNYAEGYYLQALIFREQENLKKSLMSFSKALNFGFKGNEFFIHYAQVALNAKDIIVQSSLLKPLRSIRTLQSKELLGKFYYNSSEFRKAISFFQTVSKSKNTSADVRTKYAICLARISPKQMYRLKYIKVDKKELLRLENIFKKQVASAKSDLPVRDPILNPIR